jgi:hypothetical protein
MTLNTNLLLGDTDDLINRINKKKGDNVEYVDNFEALSTRAIVNGSQVLDFNLENILIHYYF